jgi:hypothetical protein
MTYLELKTMNLIKILEMKILIKEKLENGIKQRKILFGQKMQKTK